MMKRYDQLIKIIDKGLSECSKSIDTKLAVKECYGDDIVMFENNDVDNATSSTGGNGVEMLSNLIKDILEKINEEFIQNELPTILTKEQVQLKLEILDQVVHEFISKQKAQEEHEQRDIQSAKDAVESIQLLPPGMDVGQVMTFHSYQMKKKIRDELMAEIEQAQQGMQSLLCDVEDEKRKIQDFVNKVENDIHASLNRNADLCSFNEIK